MKAPREVTGVRAAVRLALWATLLLALVAPQLYSAAAHADTVSSHSGSETCWLGASDCGPTYDPPALLGPDAYAAMTPAQAASLHGMENQAVTETLAVHDLPSSDRDAVATWARPSAQAALFALVADAIRTPEAARTHDQQNATDWMAGLALRHTEAAADHAGAEYVKWAGLDLSAYRHLVDHHADRAALTGFLSTTPEAFSDGDRAQATSGYCKYHPPAPHEEEYAGRGVQSCYTHCSSFSCLAPQAPTPSYDSLVSWGEAAANYPVLSNAAYQLSAAEIATEATFILTRAVVLVTTVVGTVASLMLEFQAVTAAILPESMFFIGSVVGVATTTATTEFLPSVASTLATAVSGAAMVSSVMIVMAAITSAVLVGIKVNDDAELPGKLASLVVGARADSDPAALLDTSDGATTLYSLFVQATLPLPRADLHCANDDPRMGSVCLNSSPVPAPEPGDPTFLVRDRDAAPGRTGAQISSSIVLPGPGEVTRTVRVAGTWFVQHLAEGSRSVDAQSLGLGYTDWTEQAQLVWLARGAQGQYSFIGMAPSAARGLDPDTCVADQTCWKSSYIRFRGVDGHRYEASVEPYRAPVGTPTYSDRPVEGHQVAFDAHGFAPAGAVGSLHYAWQFQNDGCGQPCTTVGGPSYGGVVAESPTVSFTWQTSGHYQVRLEVSDKEGRVAVTTLTVPVAGVAPVVTTDTHAVDGTAGAPVTLSGRIAYTGALDNEDVTIRWGDGVTDVAGFGPNRLGLVGNPLQIARSAGNVALVTATHAYAAPGTYQATVTTTNQAGLSDRQELTYTITDAP